jgi:hypothetical protein
VPGKQKPKLLPTERWAVATGKDGAREYSCYKVDPVRDKPGELIVVRPYRFVDAEGNDIPGGLEAWDRKLQEAIRANPKWARVRVVGSAPPEGKDPPKQLQ